jgi:hypothetical protein
MNIKGGKERDKYVLKERKEGRNIKRERKRET